MGGNEATSPSAPRAPSLADALAPVVVLITLTIALFGVAANLGFKVPMKTTTTEAA